MRKDKKQPPVLPDDKKQEESRDMNVSQTENNFVNSIGRSRDDFGRKIIFEDEFGNDYVNRDDDGY